jgi:hypothetical protein
VAIHQDIEAQVALMGREMKSSASMSLLMNWQVQHVAADSTAEIQQSIDRFCMKMSSPGSETVEIDTANPQAASGMGKMLLDNIQPMIGLKILQQMNSRGEILDVRLSDEAQRQLQSGAGAGELQQVFSADGLKSLMSQSAAVLPEHPVKPGDTWQGTAESPSPAGDLVINLSYLYRGTVPREGRPLEQIDVTLKMDVDQPENGGNPQLRITEQSGSGSMFFDAQAGRFAYTELHQDLTLETTMIPAAAKDSHPNAPVQVQKIATDMRIEFRSQRSPTAEHRAPPAKPPVRPVSNGS